MSDAKTFGGPARVSMGVAHAVIVAGGKGERLASVTGALPKVLAPIGGKPVLQHQLKLAASAGIRDVTILAGYLAEQIEAFVGDGSQFGLKVEVLVEAEPLGNAGMLVRSLEKFPEHFFVLYGDVMLAVDLGRMADAHLVSSADFTTLVHPNDHPHDSDLLEADVAGWVRAIHAYPHAEGAVYDNLVNAALYVVRRDALRPWVRSIGKVDFTKQILPGLIDSGAKVLAYSSDEYIKDMGTPARWARVEADWSAGRITLEAQRRPRPTVFLDRDGTLNTERGFLRDASQLELINGAGGALRALRQAGFRLVIVTNQPVIARGEADESAVAAIHRKLEWELGKAGAFVDRIYLCPHHPDAGFVGERPELKIACDCRKPATGLIDRACAELPVDRSRSWVIGDQTRDIEMARRAGLRSILVRTGAAGADGRYDVVSDFIVDDIASAADVILKQAKAEAA